MKKEGDEKKLNKEQLEAIKHRSGPLLIIAGAGTGKTTVVTERIKHIIFSKLANPDEILALTFTEKAAKEMEERVDIGLPYGYTNMWISTFHSFCDRVLRDEALHIGLNPRFKLMTEAVSTQLVRDNLFKLKLKYFRPLGNPTKFVGGMLQHFSRLQDEDISPQEYLRYAKKLESKKKKNEEETLDAEKTMELATAFKTYEEIKAKEGFMDFGDLIVKTLKLVRTRPNVLKEYKDRFKYILVDEFQDTNYAQNKLALLLAGKKGNITVTGDDDQSIYRFRGAAVSNIIQFKRAYPKAKIVVLTKNYRTNQKILDKAYDLIQHNNPDRLEKVEKIDKRLVSQRKKTGGEISFIHADRVENEAEKVAKKIGEIIDKGKYNYKDVAILVRANNHAEAFIRALGRHGIPHQFLGPGRLFKQTEVVDLISYLKVLYDLEDSVSLYRLLSIDFFDINARDLAMVGNFARRYNLSLFRACERVDESYVSGKTKEKIKSVLKIIEKHLKLTRHETAGQLLYYFLEETGLLKKLLNPNNPDTERKTANISKFFDKLKSYEVDHEDATVQTIVDWIELSIELGESPLATGSDWTGVNAVNLLTIHSSKGLEFPVVFLVNLVAQRFPSNHRREQIPLPDALIKEVLPVGDYHIQEERRLFYVGMTRSRDLLFLTAADYYGEAKREKKLSPFIFEAMGNEVIVTKKPTTNEQLSFLEYKEKVKPKVIKVGQRQLQLNYLSFSQIQTFQICPLHYKLRYILEVPTLPSAPLSFGISVHRALKDFYQLVEQKKRPTKKLMLDVLKENWMREGYSNKSHEKVQYERGRRILSNYLKDEFVPKKPPFALERMFKAPLLAKNKEEGRIMIGGKIDRVDVLGDGKIEIIDYKTGERVPSQKEADENLQLTFYALAATKINEKPFGNKAEDILLSFYYLDKQEKVTTSRTKEELEKAIEEIFEWREKIESSDFSCSGHIFCKTCEYALMCGVEG